MRKVDGARCAFILLTVSMLATSGADKTVTNKEDGFEITYPEAWKIIEKPVEGIAVRGTSPIAAEAKYGLFISVAVFVAKNGESLEACAKRTADESGKGMKNFKIVDSFDFKLGKFSAYKITFVSDTQIKDLVGESSLFFVASEKAIYMITAGAMKDDFDKYAKDINAIVKSFKLIGVDKTVTDKLIGADKTVTDNDNGFEITYPEAWNVSKATPDGRAAKGQSNKAEGASGFGMVTVDVFKIEPGTSLKTFAETFNAKVKLRTKNVENSDVKLGSADAIKVSFVIDTAKNTRIKNAVYVLVAGKHGYLITAGTFVDDSDKYAKDIDAIVKSFKLIEAK